MSMFFVGANKNHALILETFGIPTIASKDKLYMPTPCCQGIKSLKVSNEFNFYTSEFTTEDGTQLSVQCAASYTIDSSSTKSIMKAYKSFPVERRQVFRYPTRTYIPSEVSIEDGIKGIISKLVINKLRGMTIGDLSSIDLMFIDSIFQEAKEDLKSHCVSLTSFKVIELVRYNDAVIANGNVVENGEMIDEEVMNVAEESVVESGNPDFDFNVDASAGLSVDDPGAEGGDDEDVETRSFIISIIPEESVNPGYVRQVTTTSEIVLEHSQKIITTERDASGEVTITEREVLSTHGEISADPDIAGTEVEGDPASVDISTTDMTAEFRASGDADVNPADADEPRERSGGFSIAGPPPDLDISAEVVSAEIYDADTDADTERTDSFNVGASPSGSFNVQGEKDSRKESAGNTAFGGSLSLGADISVGGDDISF